MQFIKLWTQVISGYEETDSMHKSSSAPSSWLFGKIKIEIAGLLPDFSKGASGTEKDEFSKPDLTLLKQK